MTENSKLELENTKKELFKSIQQAHQNAIAAKERWQTADKSVTAMPSKDLMPDAPRNMKFFKQKTISRKCFPSKHKRNLNTFSE